MNLNRLSTSAFVETRGLLVSSVNVIVMVSSSVNPLTSPIIVPSGSLAVMETISGPGIGCPVLWTMTVGASADPVADKESVAVAVTVCTPTGSTGVIVPPEPMMPSRLVVHIIEAVTSPSSESLAVAVNVCEAPSLIVTGDDGTVMVTTGNALTVTVSETRQAH